MVFVCVSVGFVLKCRDGGRGLKGKRKGNLIHLTPLKSLLPEYYRLVSFSILTSVNPPWSLLLECHLSAFSTISSFDVLMFFK